MASWITSTGFYHEGDKLAGDVVVPKRPDPTYVWNGVAWVQDPALAQAANNETVQKQLDVTDSTAIRSVRANLVSSIQLSPVFPPPANTDLSFLLQNEQTAKQQRAQIQPPAFFSLADTKTNRIEDLRVQGLAYIQLGFIAQTFRWATKTFGQDLYMTLCGYQISSTLLTLDSKVHIWDANGTERALSPLNAGKLMGALTQWLYLAQREYWTKVIQVNACTTIAQVNAVVWTPVYTSAAPFNADTYVPTDLALLELPPDSILPSDVVAWEYVPPP